jgi:hypothetical protein
MRGNREDLIDEFHQLCSRKFALAMESLDSIFIQMRIVRDLEYVGEESPITSPELL